MISPIFVLAGNSCECANGVGYCSKDGIAKCAECKDGYVLNHDKTKCIVEGDDQDLPDDRDAAKGDNQRLRVDILACDCRGNCIPTQSVYLAVILLIRCVR